MIAPWKKSSEDPRQHSKKQRHHIANKGAYSQSYGFSNSYLWMWELEHMWEKAECQRTDALNCDAKENQWHRNIVQVGINYL